MKTVAIPTPADWEKLPHHPLANLIDFGAGISVAGLADHIKRNGFDDQEPIVLLDDLILDGRHRHSACVLAGITPSFRKFIGKSPEAYVAKKAFRQHLDTSQRAMIAACMTSAILHNSDQVDESAVLHTAKDASKVMNVSKRVTEEAKKVIKNGSQELQDSVKSGAVSVSDAAKVADKPVEVQRKAVEAVKNGNAKTVAKAAEEDVGAILDDDNNIVPGGLRRIFEYSDKYLSAANSLAKLAKLMRQIEESEPYRTVDALSEGERRDYSSLMSRARDKLLAWRPAVACECDKGCNDCGKKGFLTAEEVEERDANAGNK